MHTQSWGHFFALQNLKGFNKLLVFDDLTKLLEVSFKLVTMKGCPISLSTENPQPVSKRNLWMSDLRGIQARGNNTCKCLD